MADWTDLLRDGPDPSSFGQAFQQGQQNAITLQKQSLANQQAAQQAQALQAYRGQVANLLKAGDYTGASAAAYAAGDDKAGLGFGTLQQQHYAQQNAGTTGFANVLSSVAALPYEQRANAIQAAKPALVGMGVNPSQIDAFDPTDNNIKALGHVGYTYGNQVKDQISQQNADSTTSQAATAAYNSTKPITIDHDLVDPTTGQLIYRAQNQTVVGAGSTVYNGDTAASPTGAGYDTIVGDGKFGSPSSPLSTMPISAVLDFGRNTLLPATRNSAALGLAGTGMGSSGMGRYQITGSTLAAYAPKVLGANWQSQPFNADAQDKIGEAIFNDAKAGGNLSKVWTSLSPQTAAQVAQMPWSQAKNIIAAGESGGRPAAVVTPGRAVYTAPDKADPNAVDPNDPAIEQLARQYAATGEMPPLGNGGGAFRRAIVTRGAQIAIENHWTPAQIASNKAQLKASQSALAGDNKLYDTIQSAEQTALANGQRYIDLAQQAPGNTSSTWYNTLRNGIGAAASDTRVTDMNAAYNTFIGEYNRVVNSTPSGGGTLSDASRREAIDSFSNATSPQAKASAFNVLKADMAARKAAQQAIIDRRTNAISNIGFTAPKSAQVGHSSAPAAAQAMLRQNPSLRAQFDAKYGAGAAAGVLGS